jgi:hypothetical protein
MARMQARFHVSPYRQKERPEEDGMPVWLVGGRSLRLAWIVPCSGVRLSEPDSAISAIEKLSINSARRGDHNSTKIAIANARLVVRFEVAQIAGGDPASTTRKLYSGETLEVSGQVANCYPAPASSANPFSVPLLRHNSDFLSLHGLITDNYGRCR